MFLKYVWGLRELKLNFNKFSLKYQRICLHESNIYTYYVPVHVTFQTNVI